MCVSAREQEQAVSFRGRGLVMASINKLPFFFLLKTMRQNMQLVVLKRNCKNLTSSVEATRVSVGKTESAFINKVKIVIVWCKIKTTKTLKFVFLVILQVISHLM